MEVKGQRWSKVRGESPGRSPTFGVVQPGGGLLLHHVPDDEQVVGRGGGEQVGVVGTPADGRDRLLVLRHDGAQLELVVLLVQLHANKHLLYLHKVKGEPGSPSGISPGKQLPPQTGQQPSEENFLDHV